MTSRVPQITGLTVHALTRAVLLALCTAVALGRGDTRDALWAIPLALGAVEALARERSATWVMLSSAVEGVLTGLVLVTTGSVDSPFLPYLLAPAFSAGVSRGALRGALPLGGAAAALLLAPLVDDSAAAPWELSSEVAQWFVLAAMVLVVAAWMRSVSRQAARADQLEQAQLEAFRLLTALREVTRELPGTLDPTSTGEALLERARDAADFHTGAVVVAVNGSHALGVLARYGRKPHWDLSRRPGTPFQLVWSTHQPLLVQPGLPHLENADASASTGRASLLVPLVSGEEVFAVLLLEAHPDGFPPDAADDVRAGVEPLLLPLRSAVVFDEVRELATREERRRLAREIHDGIAQELVSLAYVLDGVAADVADGLPVGEQVDQLRQQLRRLVTELRMSLYDLRSDVSPDEGLGAAITRHVRAVGSASGLRVHLSLDESPARLGAEAEAELLRIVQEAVANARKHARAENLYVSCTVDPPYAQILVEDDGDGLLYAPSQDSHGLAIMRERAARVRGELVVERRSPRGTRVRVDVGRVRS